MIGLKKSLGNLKKIMMNLEIANKTFIITGSSRGIGKSIAKEFLIEGANVILVARNVENLKETHLELSKYCKKNKLFFTSKDCTKEEDLKLLLHESLILFSEINGLILNVGDGRSVSDPIPDINHWNRIWNLNFESSVFASRVFLPALIKSKGCFLFISSIAGSESIGAPLDYSTAKSALIAFSKHLSKKISPIRVNTICPGNIIFDGGTWDNKYKKNQQEIDMMLSEKVPLNRFGTPEEISAASVFLCSKRASFITGAVLIIDGGQTQSIF